MTQQQRKLLIYELDFTPEDLAANRRGEVSERQRERLTQWDRGVRQMIGWALMIFALLTAGMIGFEFLRTGGTLELFARRQTPFMLIILAVFIGVLILITLILMINSRAVKRGKITLIDGKVRVETFDVAMRGAPPYKLTTVRIERALFRFLYPSSASHFVDGKRHRIYLIRVPLFARPIPLSVERL